MNAAKLFSSFFLLLFSRGVLAQVPLQVVYMKNNGEFADRDGSDFIRIIKADSVSKGYLVTELYPDNTRKLMGKASSFLPSVVYEGVVNYFDPKGKRSASINYEKGVQAGPAYYFYSNGRVRKTVEYSSEPAKSGIPGRLDVNSTIKQYLDTLGDEIPMDGRHIVKEEETAEFGLITEEGAYLDGFKTGTWNGTMLKSNASFVENFEKGKLVNGTVSYFGKTDTYTEFLVKPQFPGGERELGKYIVHSFKWPEELLRKSPFFTSVVIYFVVNADGSTTDVQILNTVSPGIDKEMFRIWAKIKWMPAKPHGVPVRMACVMPIQLSLQ